MDIRKEKGRVKRNVNRWLSLFDRIPSQLGETWEITETLFTEYRFEVEFVKPGQIWMIPVRLTVTDTKDKYSVVFSIQSPIFGVRGVATDTEEEFDDWWISTDNKANLETKGLDLPDMIQVGLDQAEKMLAFIEKIHLKVKS